MYVVQSNLRLTRLFFAGSEVDEGSAVSLEIGRADTFSQYVAIVPSNEDEYSIIGIENKVHAQNLIKALEKAIEFGWLK